MRLPRTLRIRYGVLGLVLATLYVPDIRGEERTRFDRTGFLLSAFGLALFMAGSTTLGLDLLPAGYVLALLLTGALLLAAYILRSRRIDNPIIDLSLLRIPTLGASMIGTLLFRIGVGATSADLRGVPAPAGGGSPGRQVPMPLTAP